LSVGTEWDPDAVKKFCEQFGLSSTVTAKITNRFRNQLELRRLKKRQQEGLMAITDRVGVPVQAMPGSQGYAGPAGHGMGAAPMPQMAGMPALQNQVQQADPCAVAVQAIISAAGGIVTSQTLQQIDAVRAAFGQATGGVSGGAMSPMQTMQMVKEMFAATEQKKQSEEERNKEKAELEKRFTDMQQSMQQSMQQMMVLISANKQPQVPAESEHGKVLDALLTIVKDKNTPPPVAAPVGKTRDDQIFDQMFALMLENLKTKPTEAMAPLQQKLDSLEEQISRVGGGFAGLPTNSDQLRGIIDYTKAMADIKKTEGEFADKKANRDLIGTIAQSAFQSIGEAAASVFMQNPGTPQEKPVDLKEQPIDDGSVVLVECPKCGLPMSAPKNSPKIKCPNCGSEFSRVKQEITKEQAAEAERKFIEKVAAEEAAAKQAMEAAQSQVPVETAKTAPVRLPSPAPILGPDAPKVVDANGREIGPLSRVILNSAPSANPEFIPTAVEKVAPLVIETAEVTPKAVEPMQSIQMDSAEETRPNEAAVKDISVSGEDSSEEQG
jgi:uncharacterized Zn finger protein (UPF0148 family)